MKIRSLSSFTLAAVAVFPASGGNIPYVQLVDVLTDKSGLVTQRGMEIEVDPPLTFEDEKLVPPPTGPKTGEHVSYTLRLKIKQADKEEFKDWERGFYTDEQNFYRDHAARLRKKNKHRKAEQRRSEMGTEQASMNEKESYSDSTQNSEPKSDPFAIQKTWSEVEQLVKTNILHHVLGVTSVDPLYFVEEKKGYYLFRHLQIYDRNKAESYDDYRVYLKRVTSGLHEEISEQQLEAMTLISLYKENSNDLFKDMSLSLHEEENFQKIRGKEPTTDGKDPEQYLQEYDAWLKKPYIQKPIAFNPGVVSLMYSGSLYTWFKTNMEMHILKYINEESHFNDKTFLVNGRYEIKCKLVEPLLASSKKFFRIALYGKFVKFAKDQKYPLPFSKSDRSSFLNSNPDLYIFLKRFMVKRGEKGDETCIFDIVEGVPQETDTSGSSSRKRKADSIDVAESVSKKLIASGSSSRKCKADSIDVAESVPVEKITLGSSLLTYCPVSIDNTGDQKKYQFFTVDRVIPNLELLDLHF